MNILCTICRDLVTSADLCSTKCGHLFHQACVSQWLARSKSCPQCRGSITSKCIFHLYVTTPEEGAPGNDDAATLQSKLDDTMLKLRQQSMEITELQQKLTKLNLNLEETNNVLKAAKEKLKRRDSEIAVYREKITYLEIENTKLPVILKDFEQCQKKLQALQGLQTVFNGTVQEVESLLNSSPDLRTVVTYTTALKKALFESEAKRSELRNKLQATTKKLADEQGVSNDLQIKYNELLESYEILEKTKLDKAFSESSSEDTSKPTCQIPEDKCVLNTSDTSLKTLVNKIEESSSPYFNLKKNSLGWASFHHQKPSTAKSLFDPSKLQKAFNHKTELNTTKKPSESNELIIINVRENDIPLNGQKGAASSKIPISRHLVPNVTSKHRLKRPNSDKVGSVTELAKKPRPFDK